MENSTFKCVAFGGFDKQDVIRYIEQSAREAAEVREQLQLENERLRTESADLQAQVRALRESWRLSPPCERMPSPVWNRPNGRSRTCGPPRRMRIG